VIVVGDDASLLGIRLEDGQIVVGGISDGGAPWEFALPLDEARRLRDGLDGAIQAAEAIRAAFTTPAGSHRRLRLVPRLRAVAPRMP
jgi:hypothetical protein